MASPFDAYLTKLRETPLDEQTEHTGRSALEALLNQFAGKAGAKGITVQHEPKREAGKGALECPPFHRTCRLLGLSSDELPGGAHPER